MHWSSSRTLPLALLVSLALLCALPSPAVAAGWAWPVQGEVLTQYRNGDDPYAAGQHRGIDIAAEPGKPVVAAAAGAVRFAGTAGSSGTTISIRTADGRFDVSYLHLSALDVRTGDSVALGQRIGTAGTTGTRSVEAPHLHLGVREAGERHAYRDPLELLPPLSVRLPEQAPRVPVAAPVPVRAPRAPAPVRVPGPRRVRVPVHRPVRVPVTRRAPVPVRLRPAAPVASPVPVAVPRPVPVSPRTAARPVAGPAAPGLGPAPRVVSPERPGALDARAPSAAPRQETGLDLGWAVGLAALALAIVLGGPGRSDRRGSARRGGLAARLLRPLLGGR